MSDIFTKLSAPFPGDRISWRLGSTNKEKTRGLALAYIDARDVMERLDQVVGPGNWQNRYPHANGKTVCEIGLRIGDDWVWKSDGAGDSDVEAEKGALSDAFKRAAVRWGIGRYLYDLASPWVEIEPFGKSFKIKDSEHVRLSQLLHGENKSKSSSSKAEPPKMQWPKDQKNPKEWQDAAKRFILILRNHTNIKAIDELIDDNAVILENIRGEISVNLANFIDTEIQKVITQFNSEAA